MFVIHNRLKPRSEFGSRVWNVLMSSQRNLGGRGCASLCPWLGGSEANCAVEPLTMSHGGPVTGKAAHSATCGLRYTEPSSPALSWAPAMVRT